MRANISARVASATVYFILNVYHIRLFSFGFEVGNPSLKNLLPSPAIGIMICSDLCIYYIRFFIRNLRETYGTGIYCLLINGGRASR